MRIPALDEGDQLSGMLGSALADIAESLVAHLHDLASERVGKVDVASGMSGILLFLDYLARYDASERWAAGSELALIKTVEWTETATLSTGLYSGFTGVAWTLAHLARVGSGVNVASLEDVDRYLLRQLDGEQWLAPYDLISGLVGIGAYGVERGGATGRDICYKVLDHLRRMAMAEAGKLTWRTHEAFLVEREKAWRVDGVVNCGVAHGVPGVIGLAVLVEKSFGLRAVDWEMCARAVEWLLTRRDPERSPCVYPSLYDMSGKVMQSRLAWCYGDPGVCGILYLFGQLKGDSALRELALHDLALAEGMSASAADVVDGGLCHGAAGLAHIYGMIGRLGCDQRLQSMSLTWARRMLGFRRPEYGFGGFCVRENGVWRDDPGFLTGAAGVGLAILGLIRHDEAEWGRLLLIG